MAHNAHLDWDLRDSPVSVPNGRAIGIATTNWKSFDFEGSHPEDRPVVMTM
jgi:hypothetical protein